MSSSAPRAPLLGVLALVLACGTGSSESESPGGGGSKGTGDGGINLGHPAPVKDAGGDSAPPPPIEATIHAIDTDAIAAGSLVHVTGAVLVAPVRSAGVDQEGACTYDGYVQDPSSPAPAGIRVFVDGLACDGDAAACTCAPVGAISTRLDSLTGLGDVYDIVGFVSVFPQGTGANEHGIYTTQITKTGSGPQVAPLVISADADAGASFAPGGAAFAANEGMLVTISAGSPSAATMTGADTFTFGGAGFVVDYAGVYEGLADGGGVPGPWTSITGVAWTAYGGVIAPRSASDFTH